MKPTFTPFPDFVFRTPLFPLDAPAEDTTLSPEFREALYLASPELYEGCVSKDRMPRSFLVRVDPSLRFCEIPAPGDDTMYSVRFIRRMQHGKDCGQYIDRITGYDGQQTPHPVGHAISVCSDSGDRA